MALGPNLSRTFSSLQRHRNYRLYFAGQVVSVSGTWMQSTAQAWLVLQLTGSPAAVGLLAVCQFGPFAVLGPLGGVLSDRLDRRRTLIVTQSLPILGAGALAVLALTGTAHVWEVDLIAGLNGILLVLDTPARQAFTVEMVGRRELPNAVGLNSTIFNASRIIGPGLAGLLIGSVGTGACFALNAVSYAAVLVGLLRMRPEELFRDAAHGRPRPRVIAGIVEGVRYASQPGVVRTALLMLLVVGTISVNFNVLLPVVADRTLRAGPASFGLLTAAFGAGALGGALVSASVARPDVRVLLGACAGLGVAEVALAPVGTVWLTAVVLGITGGAFSLYASNTNATIQLAVPDALRGRVMSLYAYVFFGTAPLGGYLTGWLADRGGTRLAWGVAGAAATLSAAAGTAWWWRAGEAAAPPRRRAGPATDAVGAS